MQSGYVGNSVFWILPFGWPPPVTTMMPTILLSNRHFPLHGQHDTFQATPAGGALGILLLDSNAASTKTASRRKGLPNVAGIPQGLCGFVPRALVPDIIPSDETERWLRIGTR